MQRNIRRKPYKSAFLKRMKNLLSQNQTMAMETKFYQQMNA